MSAEAASSLLARGPSCRSVPVEHLDYSFIQNCSDPKHLEQILDVLRSGQEGFYPQLIEFCEKHIEKLAPKSRSLRKEKPPSTSACFSTEEWSKMKKELQVWEENIRRNEAGLNCSPVFCDVENMAPVRGQITVQKTISTKVKDRKPSIPRSYTDWDRFDVEKECIKIDESEQKIPEVVVHAAPPTIKYTINSTALTDPEKDVLACREKNKGNECFKSGDYEEAVVYYTRSLSVVFSVSALNNRAQACIKLQQWTAALSDCQAVLQQEPGNVKALLRRATVHKHLGHMHECSADLRTVLLMEPHNITAQKLLTEVENHQQKPKAGRKLLIQEVEGNEVYQGVSQTKDTEAGMMQECEVIRNTHHKPNNGNPNSKPTQNHIAHSTTNSSRRVIPAPGTIVVNASTLTCLKNEESVLLNTRLCGETNTQTNSEYTTADSSEAQFQFLMTESRDLFTNGHYQAAAGKYSQCLQIRPQECAVYTNRALCYIKLEHFTEAKQDCDSVLHLEPTNKKAFFRRALANKGLGDYLACCSDLQQVMHWDASVVEAVQLLDEVTLLMNKQKCSSLAHRRRVLIIEVENEDAEGHSADEDQNRPSFICTNGQLISLQPCNAFEFGQALNAACTHGDLQTCAELLRSVTSERLPQYISTQLDGHTISFIIQALNTHLLCSHPDLVYQHLKHLHTAHRFSMVLMLLNSEERRHVTELFKNLSFVQTEAFSQNDVEHLANKYIFNCE